jgi:hypothetical protein
MENIAAPLTREEAFAELDRARAAAWAEYKRAEVAALAKYKRALASLAKE